MCLRKLKQGLCVNPQGWDGARDGGEVLKGGDICIPMADSYVYLWLRFDRKQQSVKQLSFNKKINIFFKKNINSFVLNTLYG